MNNGTTRRRNNEGRKKRVNHGGTEAQRHGELPGKMVGPGVIPISNPQFHKKTCVPFCSFLFSRCVRKMLARGNRGDEGEAGDRASHETTGLRTTGLRTTETWPRTGHAEKTTRLQDHGVQASSSRGPVVRRPVVLLNSCLVVAVTP